MALFDDQINNRPDYDRWSESEGQEFRGSMYQKWLRMEKFENISDLELKEMNKNQ